MGWGNVLKGIGRGAKAIGKGTMAGINAADPFIEMGARMGLPFLAQADAIMDGVQAVEESMGDHPGQSKQEKVVDIFNASLATTRAVLQAKGKDLIVDQARVRAVIDRQVAAAKEQAAIIEETQAIVRDATIVDLPAK